MITIKTFLTVSQQDIGDKTNHRRALLVMAGLGMSDDTQKCTDRSTTVFQVHHNVHSSQSAPHCKANKNIKIFT